MTLRARASLNLHPTESSNLGRLRREARSRAALYNTLIERDMLVDGMVVHRDGRGRAEGLCDSLLFSSLRFRSLVALGFVEEGERAWQAIDASHAGGVWWRHPQCRGKSLSRDMLMGLMIALEARPPGGTERLHDLLKEIGTRNGSIGDGPFFVSYLSPGPAGLLRHLAQSTGIPFDEWPWVLKQSFSSIEFDAMFVGTGYEAHLAGLGIWLEQRLSAGPDYNPRSVMGQIERLWTGAPPTEMTQVDRQRLVWVSASLARANPENLFFSTLRLSTRGALDNAAKEELLTSLLAMPQFPATRLPRDCDRDADYLWQRRGEEYAPADARCGSTWSGVDFLWLAGILAGGD